MSEQIYFGDWNTYEDMRGAFSPPPGTMFPEPDEVLHAEYTYEDYSGRAWVLFVKHGVPYEVHGSHCSCNGLEECWDPELTSYATITLWQFNELPQARQRFKRPES